jgi:SAM-dependent methyltransferase
MRSESIANGGFTTVERTPTAAAEGSVAAQGRDYSETSKRYVELAATEQQLRSFRYILPWCGADSVLDLGCAKGAYLRQFGGKSLGVDVSRPNLEYCNGLGLRAVDMDLNRDLSIPARSFPVVFCSHVLEHVDAPIRLLRECHRILSASGRLILGLPIETSIVNWVRGQKYFYHHPGHLYSFSMENIDVLLKKTGFEIERFYFEPRIVPTPLWLALMQRLPAQVAYPLALAYWVVARKGQS